jgi:SAM-dependent methyltransferase
MIMRNQALHEKYRHGAHWLDHPETDAQRFSALFTADKQLCDIGCSQGRDLNVMGSYDLNPFGVDISLPDLLHASNPVINGDTHLLPMNDETFDGIYMVNVLHYLADPNVAMAEVYRTLQHGGFFFLHINQHIEDVAGNVDLVTSDEEIADLLGNFLVAAARSFTRYDRLPVPHTHTILELVLKK